MHNVVAFLEKHVESDGFAEIIDFLKASSVHYALTVNPIIYTSCIEQFWATAKVQTVNGVRQLPTLIDKKKLIITESSIRSDLHLDNADGTDCLPITTIFKELTRMGYEKPSQKLTFYKAFFSPQWKYFIHTITQCLSAKSTVWNEFSSIMASLIICLATNQKFNLSRYIFDAMLGDMSNRKKIFVNPSHTKKVLANMKRARKDFSGRITLLFDTMMVPTSEEVEVTQDEIKHEESIPTPSNNPQPSGEDSMQLNDLMVLCTKLQAHVLNLEKAKDAQAKEIADLKKRVQRLERKKKSRTTGLKRLKKVGMSRRVESYKDQESLGDHEDASKQGRSIKDIDTDVEMLVEAKIDEKDKQSTNIDDSTAGEAVTTASVEGNAAPTTIKEITLAQTLIQIKAAKPKVVTTAATTTTTTRAKAREPEVPLKRKDQVALDEQMARDVQAQLEAELIEEEKHARKREEEANIALIESWDNTQAMMDADFELAQRLQIEEQGEITIEERSRLFVELMNKRTKHFAMLRAEEKRRKPPTKAQKRNQMSTYLKNMGGYKHNQLKSKSYKEIQKMFDNEIRIVNTFIPIDSEVVKSKKEIEESSKGTEDELESDKTKKIEGSEEKAKCSRKKMIKRKRAGKEQQ
ncbi:hypothetical protein Tco_0715341 [Tanacetum coccineum]